MLRTTVTRLIAGLLLVGVTATVARAETLTFVTEDYPPYNFRTVGGYAGVGYEQVVAIMETVKADYTVEMMPWARAISLAATEPNHCAFATARIPEREARFKWVGPLARDRNVMITRKRSGISAANIDEARQYTVGTQRNDYTQALLDRYDFPKVDLATNLQLTLQKLLSGRIQMMPMSERYYLQLVEQGQPLDMQFVLSDQTLAIACNPATPDSLIAAMQASLDRIITDGRQKSLHRQYNLPTTD